MVFNCFPNLEKSPHGYVCFYEGLRPKGKPRCLRPEHVDWVQNPSSPHNRYHMIFLVTWLDYSGPADSQGRAGGDIKLHSKSPMFQEYRIPHLPQVVQLVVVL